MRVLVGSGLQPRSSVEACRGPAAAALVGLYLAGGAAAQELPPEAAGLARAATGHERSRMEISASSLPLFDSLDGATHSSRLDMLWLPPRRPNLGLSLGLTSQHGQAAPLGGSGIPPAVDVGLHWRYRLDGQHRIDVTAWRRVTPPDAAAKVHARQAPYGARFEMQLKSLPSRRFIADRGFLGLQLQGGARITLKRRHGGPMLYYRAKF